MTNILGSSPGGVEWVVILIVFGIPVLLIVLFVRYLVRNDKERRRLRLEVAKLADELEQMRKRAKDAEKNQALSQS